MNGPDDLMEEWALAEQPRREVPAKPVYIDDATGREVDEDWWPPTPKLEQRAP